MTLVGATGHQALPVGAAAQIRRDVRTALKQMNPPLRIITSLAAGSDQLIATEGIDLGGSIDAIIPSANYEESFETADDRANFRRLLAEASAVVTLGFPAPSEEAYWDAGKIVVDRCDVLVAVWDGQPANGLGGTGDVVRYAREQGRRVLVVWPPGVIRR